MMHRQQGNDMPMMGMGQGTRMPLQQGEQSGMPMMQMMQNRQSMMREHMQTMEARMAAIEDLLRQLVESQKRE